MMALCSHRGYVARTTSEECCWSGTFTAMCGMLLTNTMWVGWGDVPHAPQIVKPHGVKPHGVKPHSGRGRAFGFPNLPPHATNSLHPPWTRRVRSR